MICNNCGSENPSGTRFCQTCGAGLTDTVEMEPRFDYESPQPGNPLTKAVKKVAGSATFFFATLFFTAVIVLSILSAIYGTADIMAAIRDYIEPYARQLDTLAIGITSEDIYQYLDAVPAQNLALVIIAKIPAIAYALALWMIFFSGKMKRISTSGLTLIKVFKILKFILVIIAGVAVLGAAGLGTYGLYSDPEEYEDLYKYALAGTLLIALLFLLAIIYYAKLIGSLTAAKMAMNGQPGGKFSGYAAFVLILSALLNVIITVAVSALLFDYYGIATGILSGLSTVMYALLIGGARRAVYADL